MDIKYICSLQDPAFAVLDCTAGGTILPCPQAYEGVKKGDYQCEKRWGFCVVVGSEIFCQGGPRTKLSYTNHCRIVKREV